MRTCSVCKRDFPKESGRKGSAKCIDCLRQQDRARYEANKDKWVARAARVREEDLEAVKAKNRQKGRRHRLSDSNTIHVRYLKARYGLTVEQFAEMEASQEGKCKICGGPPRGRWNRLHVDHDHRTGKVRGLLCFACNSLLGLALDDTEILAKAMEYLNKDK